MVWTPPKTWAGGAGNEVTSADFNTHIRDNLLALTTWEPYTPTLTNWTLGNGSLTGSAIEAGGLVIGKVIYTVGSTDTPSGQLEISLPTTGVFDTGNDNIGGALFDDSSGPNFYGFTVADFSNANMRFVNAATGGLVTDTSPFTFAAGDIVTGRFMYEAA